MNGIKGGKAKGGVTEEIRNFSFNFSGHSS
jgi:hypothetical protein